MPTVVPGYFDSLIEAFWAGHAGRNVHLGYWDDPPSLAAACSEEEFEAAQARLTRILVELAQLRSGQTVLDVGCGFGGTLETLLEWSKMRLFGVNVDRRQLDICRTLPESDNTLSLIMADACSLPFGRSSFDRVFCIEAMFHFRSRGAFFREVAYVLASGGRLVLSDILLHRPDERSPLPSATLEAIIGSEYGPWPQPWVTIEELLQTARGAGLDLERLVDATHQTLPTYRITAPQKDDRLPVHPSAGNVLRWLHSAGHLSYLCMSFTKP